MPSNIKELKAAIRKKVKDPVLGPLAASQQIVASSVLRSLANFTNLDEGYLAGGWTVLVDGKGSVPTLRYGENRRLKKLPINRTRRPSLKNINKIDKLNGKKTVVIGNNIFYGIYVNDGINQRPSRFVERAVYKAKAEAESLGIKVEIGR